MISGFDDDGVAGGKVAALIPVRLSGRQTEVLRYLSYGYSYSAIAKVFGISPETVRTLIRQVYDRLGVCSKPECLEKAYNLGLLSL